MSFKEKVKKFRFGYLLLAIMLCACGALIIVYPNESMKTVCYKMHQIFKAKKAFGPCLLGGFQAMKK